MWTLRFYAELFTFCFGLPGGFNGKEYACSAGDPHSIPGWEDTLEKGMVTHSSIQRSLADYSPWGHKELNTAE